jgi:putative transposase
MKKKKKNKINIPELLNKIFSDIIDKEKLIEIYNDYTKPNLDFINDFFKYDNVYYNFDLETKKKFIKIKKNFDFEINNLIYNYNIKKNINQQFNYFLIKYENFATKFYKGKNDYTIYSEGFLSIDDFLMLIKDSKCVPFWNDDCKELSEEIFLPTDNNLKNSKIPKTFNYNNWFKTEHKINSNSLENNKKLEIIKDRNFVKQYRDKKTGKIKNIIKSHKIKIYFNSEQRKFIKRLYGIYRYFYNRTVNYINNYDNKNKKTFYFIDYKNKQSKIDIDLKDETNIFTLITIRKLIKKNYPKWVDEINFPSHLIDMAIKEAVSSYIGCLNKYKKYKIPFNLKIKTKKDKIQTMNLEEPMIKKESNSLFYNLKDNIINKYVFRNLKTSCKLNKYLNICDSSLSWNQRTNEYYLNLNFENIELPPKEILSNKKICSIDVGVKTMLTIYSDNSVEKIGIGIRYKIEKLCRDIDIIISKQYKKKEGKYKYNHQKRRALRKALHRKIKYLDNIKEDLHNKSVKYLCDNYGKIIIPPFETQKMVSNIKLDSKTSRNLMCISYYKFLSKLKSRCIEYNIDLVIRPEYYTSKTCTKCGNIKHDLKNADIYICKNCGIKIDRDTNGARNILLRNLTI